MERYDYSDFRMIQTKYINLFIGFYSLIMDVPNYLIIISVVFCTLFLFYFSNHVFNYYAKFAIYIFVCFIASVIVIPVAICRGKDVSNLLILSYICQTAAPLIGVKFIIEGSEYITRDETFIVMANHQSCLDILGMFYLYPLLKKCTFIMKEEILYYVPFGICLWLCGNFFIPRSKNQKSKEVLNEALRTIQQENIKLWIFPEGTRSDGQILEFKKGGFHMALSSQLPILPIVFSSYHFLDHKEKYFRQGEIVISALPPIYTQEKSLEDMETLIAKIREKMMATLDELNNGTSVRKG